MEKITSEISVSKNELKSLKNEQTKINDELTTSRKELDSFDSVIKVFKDNS